jgi:hypothetical protein
MSFKGQSHSAMNRLTNNHLVCDWLWTVFILFGSVGTVIMIHDNCRTSRACNVWGSFRFVPISCGAIEMLAHSFLDKQLRLAGKISRSQLCMWMNGRLVTVGPADLMHRRRRTSTHNIVAWAIHHGAMYCMLSITQGLMARRVKAMHLSTV